MQYILFLCFILSFLFTIIVTPYWIRIAKSTGLVGCDVHKTDRRKVAELGGAIVILGFIFGVLFYIGLDTFYLEHFGAENLQRDIQILASLVTILLISLIGFFDDIIGWKTDDKKVGLKQWQKPLLVLFATIPMVVVNAGHSAIALPFIGRIDLGIIYAITIVPLLITFTANAFNMVAGYNGLETGQGIIILTFIGYVAWMNDFGWVATVAACMIATLAGFYLFNRTPAKIFPGDTLTYSVGALIGILAISANMEKLMLIVMTPYIIEFLLKARGKMKKESFAKVNEDGSLSLRDGIYGIEHISLALIKRVKKKVYEQDVVMGVHLIQMIFILIACFMI